MELANLFVTLGAQAEEYYNELDNSLKATDSWASKIASGAGKAFKGIALGAGAAVVGGVALIGGAALSVANDVDVASGRIQAQLGLTESAASEFGDVILDVYGNNFGESIADAGDAVSTVASQFQRLGDVAVAEIGTATESALALRDAFGIDVNESAEAAAVLMDEFGLSSTEAFDFVTSGMQRGLNSSDDFLDSITEYSNLFAGAGADAGEFFSVMETGLAGGVLGTDKAADLFKEFTIRVMDGSDSTVEALEALSGPTEDLVGQLRDGTLSGADAFTMLKDRIADLDDPIQQNQLGVALFGTQWEDLGLDAVFAIDAMNTGLDETAGATDSLNSQYENFGSMMEGLKRSAQVALAPLGEKLMEIGSDLMPVFQSAMEWIGTELPPLIDGASVAVGTLASWFRDTVLPAVREFSDWLTGTAVPAVMGFVGPIIDVVGPALASAAEWARSLLSSWSESLGGVQGVTSSVSATVQQIITTVFGAIQSFWAEHGEQIKAIASSAWELIQLAVTTVANTVQQIVTTVFGAIQSFWAEHGAAILVVAQNTWNLIQAAIGNVLDIVQGLIGAFISAIKGDWSGFGENLRGVWDAIWNTIKTIFETAKANLLAVISSFIGETVSSFSDIDWPQLGRDVIEGIGRGISNAAGFLADAARNAAQAALDAAKAFLGIGSPSKLFALEVGEPSGEGIGVGFERAARDVSRRIRNATAGILDEVSPIGVSLAGESGFGATGSGPAYNLNVYTSAPSEPIIADFQLLAALG